MVVVKRVEVEGREIWVKKDERGIVEIFANREVAELDPAFAAV